MAIATNKTTLHSLTIRKKYLVIQTCYVSLTIDMAIGIARQVYMLNSSVKKIRNDFHLNLLKFKQEGY